MRNIEIPYLITAYAMGAVIYAINKNKDFLTVSETAAGNRIGRQAFFWGLLVSGILYLLMMNRWVIPHFGFSLHFKLLASILFIFQVITGTVPARGKILNVVHLLAAFGLGITMLITVLAFASHDSINAPIRFTCALLALTMTLLIISVHKISSTKYFRHQNIFFGCWHVALLLVVYLG